MTKPPTLRVVDPVPEHADTARAAPHNIQAEQDRTTRPLPVPYDTTPTGQPPHRRPVERPQAAAVAAELGDGIERYVGGVQ